MPAVSPEKAQFFCLQQGHPQNILLLLCREHHYIFLYMLLSLYQSSQQKLQSAVNICLKISRLPVQALSTLCKQQVIRKAGKIPPDQYHALWPPEGVQRGSGGHSLYPTAWAVGYREWDRLCTQGCSAPHLPIIPDLLSTLLTLSLTYTHIHGAGLLHFFLFLLLNY